MEELKVVDAGRLWAKRRNRQDMNAVGARVCLRRCAFHNTTDDKDAAHSPRYTLKDGSLLNLMRFPVLDETLFAEPYDTNTCAVVFGGPNDSLRNLAPRLNK